MATHQRRNRQDAGNEAAEDRSSAPLGRAEAVRPGGPGRAVGPSGVGALQRSAGNAAAAAAVQSDGSRSQGQPFMTVSFDSQSSGDEYQASDDQMSASP
ncbi:hypothetical protein [Streptomyces griseoluteus]|uniref:hypothetical protein n=1 Tax=Streptomyces griseoluteus TaxID=29306 RepID=UPI0036FBFA89